MRRRVEPALARTGVFRRLAGEMPGRGEPKGGPPQPVRVVLARRPGEPAGECAEIGAAIAAAGPALLQHADRGEQIRDSLACPLPEQRGLAPARPVAAEPRPDTCPSALPVTKLGLKRV